MAGKPGMKGGGGPRPGAGRKPRAPTIAQVAAAHDDPAAFLAGVMCDSELDVKLRVDAAKALLPYKHAKLGEGGKKEQKQAAAEKVASRFASGAPPKLAAVGGKRM